MNIITYCDQVSANLERDLGILMLDGENKLIQFESAFYMVDKALEKVKAFLSNYEFTSEEEEVEFFKMKMTEFLKESVYYSELFNMESLKPPGPKKEIKRFYEKELRSIQYFLQSHQNLYNYLLTKKTNQDKIFFLRSAQAPVYKPNLFWHTLDTRYCTVYTLYFARIKGTLALSQYIHHQLKIINGEVVMGTYQKKNPLRWTGKKVELIELVYALKLAGVLNHGRADLKEIALKMGAFFGLNLNDFYRTFTEISTRKKSRTAFLDSMRDQLNNYIDNGDSLR
ncbi:RteC domain-containing protein [Algoriphagus sp.]|uniref:RteC domain-containing protein n=1 Tax=Algoriphagus sp. TaxID=1872435 RepID=UPI00262E3F4D|nr:RteC domain-containing protein [Algoriphagus sp.]